MGTTSNMNSGLKATRDAFLKQTREKMGISEEKRTDFQNRMKEKRERQAQAKENRTDRRVKEVAAVQNITPEAARTLVTDRQNARTAQMRVVRADLVDKRMEQRANQIATNRGITTEQAGNVMQGRIAQRAGQIAANRGITMEDATRRAENQMFGQQGLKRAVEKVRMGDRREAMTSQMATQQGLTPEAAAQAMTAQVTQRAENISNRRGIAIGEAQKRAQRQMFGRPQR